MKTELRKQLLQKRNEMPQQVRLQKSHCIYEQLLPYLETANCIGVYKSFGSEVDTEELISNVINRHKKVCVPVCEKQGIMHFHQIQNNTQFQKNKMGISEPIHAPVILTDEIDLMLVPMVGFYKKQRLGYGGGYYDRYLANSHALKIGLAFALQEIEFESEPYDILMDIILHE